MIRTIRFLPILFLLCSGCSPLKGYNYTDPQMPRFADLSFHSGQKKGDTIRIVSYNIKHGKKIDKAIKLLTENEHLKDADILLLQEMNDQAVQHLAAALKCNYVYYPSAVHPVPKDDLGNAVLSKWPIISDSKVLLPHLDPQKLQRIAVHALIKVDDTVVSVHSTHMDIFLQPEQRADQLNKILHTVPRNIQYSIVGGDFNSVTPIVYGSLLKHMLGKGYVHVTEKVKWTYKHWYFMNKKTVLDHIFSNGFKVIDAGMVKDRSVSDHLPVWAELKFEDPDT